MRWFGESWGAPINLSSRHTVTPVGVECADCLEAIQDGDQGMILPHAGAEDDGPRESVFHRRCFMAAVGIAVDPDAEP